MSLIQTITEWAKSNIHIVFGIFLVVMAILQFSNCKKIPSVRFSTLGLDNVTRYANDPIRFLTQARLKYGEVFKVNMLFSSTIWLYSPQLNKEYLETREDVWSFGDGMGKFLNKIVGAEYWQHLKTFVSSLSRGISRGNMLAHFQNLAEAETEKAVHEWGERDSVELFEAISELVHRIIVQCLMGPDFYENNVDELFSLLHMMEDNLGNIWNFVLPEWMPHPAARKLWTARDRMREIFQERIAERSSNPERWRDAQDYISFTLRDPATQHLDSFYPVHHTLLMFAAHTSTVALIAWTILELLKSPFRLPSLRESLEESPKSSESAYLGALLKETGRHYSSISDVRYARRAKTISTPFKQPGTGPYLKKLKVKFPSMKKNPEIPTGSIVSISPYLTHHDPQLWAVPDAWYPERWIEEPGLAKRMNNKTSIGYMPFGAGSHHCPGEKMATMIAQVVISMIAKRADIEFADPEAAKHSKFNALDFAKVGSPWLKGDVRVRITRKQ